MTGNWAWLGLVLLVLQSSVVSYFLVRAFPWRDSQACRELSLPLAATLAPFVLGLATIAALAVFGGRGPVFHLVFIFLFLAVAGFVLWRMQISSSLPQALPRPQRTRFEWRLLVCILIVVADLVYLAVQLPLTENDALEYGIVGRAIYESGSLSVYPLLNADQSLSGFFGPWTHPPLYTSLIYLTYLLQEDASFAELMKILSPWFTLGAAWSLYGMGRMRGPACGLIASLLFLATPLLFLGAQTAAIDALPISGMVLIMVGVVGADRSRPLAPVSLGLLAGMAIWTHSQAILYLPILVGLLVATGGIANWRASLSFSLKTMLVVGAVACYPYLRNTAIYGTPISDTPVVFALPSLDWDGFFKYARSIYDVSTRLQYGVFKGLSALHSYGLVFWLCGLAGGFYVLTGRMSGWGRALVHGTSKIERQDWPLIVPVALISIYYAGILASLAIGSDLMIRNDRYLLVMVPPAALIAGCGICDLLERRARGGARSAGFNVVLGLMFLMIAGHAGGFLMYGNYLQWDKLVEVVAARPSTSEFLKAKYNEVRFGTPLEPNVVAPSVSLKSDPLSAWNGVTIVKQFGAQMRVGEKVLAIRPADMFYSGRKMVSYLDPRMIDLYGESDPQLFIAGLEKLGVQFVQMPDYWIPPVPNSALMEVLANPAYSSLVLDSQFHQLYRLVDGRASNKEDSQVEDLTARNWIEYPKFGVGGPTFGLPSLARPVGPLPYTAKSDVFLLSRNYSHMLTAAHDRLAVQPGKEYLIRLDAEGEGFMRVWIWRHDERKAREGVEPPDGRQSLVGDFVLSPRIKRLAFERRLRIPNETTHIRIGIERYGVSALTLKSASLTELNGVHER